MAEKRMFAKSIVLTDAFLDMPMSARGLYFTLGMLAYNKGIVVGVKGIARICGAGDEDILTLATNGFIEPLDNGNYRIVHWYENNGAADAKKRLTYPYRKWRNKVIERDRACVLCGSTERLHAHHIKPFASYPELRLDLDNGITLCETCHRRYHGLEKKNGEQR